MLRRNAPSRRGAMAAFVAPRGATAPGSQPEKAAPPADQTTARAAPASVKQVLRPNPDANVTAAPRARAPFKPTAPAVRTTPAVKDQENDAPPNMAYYAVVFRKAQAKKHKTWDGDGVLAVRNAKFYVLQSSEGKEIAKTTNASWGVLCEGEEVAFSGRDIQVMGVIDAQAYETGQCFLGTPGGSATSGTATNLVNRATAFKKPRGPTAAPEKAEPAPPPPPRHNPDAPGALVMPEVPARPRGATAVPVVVDPVLSTRLRPHQREGVTFLYRCVMGLQAPHIQGAILADEMGLGKTLQAITLIWTLLKQNPIASGPGPRGVAQRVLVVCPATLVRNWAREFRTWLGPERLGVFVADGTAEVRDFTLGRVHSVMVIGYERLRLLQEQLANVRFDLVVCDEGHRLKSAAIKTVQALRAVAGPRRVLLSGTPVQNDLGEFYAMADFASPGVLGTPAAFRQVFEAAIMRGREQGASAEEVRLGEQRCEELARITRLFVLRRTHETNAEYLPPRHETVLVCRLAPGQADVYRTLLAELVRDTARRSSDANWVLGAITRLRKLCNSPSLLLDDDDASTPNSKDSPPGTKVLVLQKLLDAFAKEREKVVLVSNFTQTLNVLEEMCRGRENTPTLRLDGNTPVAKRLEHVDRFNQCAFELCPVFLLSARAGGTGLNLVGASRLVMVDGDWNPSVDAQAMARIWREGQRRAVHIYRLLTAGTIEEKIFQRQLVKTQLSRHVLDDAGAAGSAAAALPPFSRDELRRLFVYRGDSDCETHDLVQQRVADQEQLAAGLAEWQALPVASGSDAAERAIEHDECLTAVLSAVDSASERILRFAYVKHG